MTRVNQVNLGDTIYYEEDVFVQDGKRHTCIGKRCSIGKVIRKGISGQVIWKIMKSAGANAYSIGAEVPKPIANLMRGYNCGDMDFNEGFASGGVPKDYSSYTIPELDVAYKRLTTKVATRELTMEEVPDIIAIHDEMNKREWSWKNGFYNIQNNDSIRDSMKELFGKNFKSGGHLEGVKDGEKVILTDAKQGGMGTGAKHTEGGIKGSVGSEKKPIEFEGEEIILTAPVSSSQDKYEFEGKQLTGREIASKINQDHGGVSFAEGGEIKSCRCSGKNYKFGGQMYCSRDIIKYINFMSHPVTERIALLKK